MDRATKDDQTARMQRLLDALRDDPDALEEFLRLGERLANYRRETPSTIRHR